MCKTFLFLNFTIMYASLFDLDANSFDDSCSVSYTEAYNAIKRYMLANSFTWIQGNLYFASPVINSVNCVLIVQHMSKSFSWFNACVKDIRLLRIEENNDLLQAIF